MRRCHLLFLLVTGGLTLAAGCSGNHSSGIAASSTMALSRDDHNLWVVNSDADSVSLLDPSGRTLVAEVPLGAVPAVGAGGRYEPAVTPRGLALSSGEDKLYVVGQRANSLFVLDTRRRQVLKQVAVATDPVSVVAAPDGSAVYVVSYEAATITKIDPARDEVVARLTVPEHPWGISVSEDGKSLYVSHLLLGAGVTTVDVRSFTVAATVAFATQPRNDVKTLPQGLPRGVYTAVPRPGDGEVWAPHLLLAVETSEPALDFQSTVFPTISTVGYDGAREGRRLLFTPIDDPGGKGAFSDVVSGPRAIAFTPDGRTALVAHAQSEDVMVFDAALGVEVGLVRPLPATLLEGIVVDHKGQRAFVHGRNTQNVVVLALHPGDKLAPAVVDGQPIPTAGGDPMPPKLRLGQRLFYTANSAAFPITRNFWVACSTCHLEGATDAVTWRFFVGPRDTPSNAGGPVNTGFLLRQALRKSVFEYDATITIEQGGAYHRDDPRYKADFDALGAYVDLAVPFPQNPNLSPDGKLTPLQERGHALFQQHCVECHPGAYLTDSAMGNPMLDFNGPIVLHDVGTCVKVGPIIDQPAPDEVIGKMHTACDFDSPTLRGVFATAPYFHDGSAATLRDVMDRLTSSKDLSSDDKDALVAYTKTL